MTVRENIAPTSTEGHYVDTKKVVELDKTNEIFLVEDATEMSTPNHTTLPLEQGAKAMVIAQKVYNPYAKGFEVARD
jgi:hypothetical protein